jgi:murein DD-endopeptidase MepM/ murein hydrolase activator NlpD
LATDNQHHSSKKKRYTVVLVPYDEVGKSRNFQLIPWKLAVGFSIFAVLVVTFVLLALTYTPLGRLFPLANQGLEIKYSGELISLNRQMTNLMEQLIELRTYNIKLRRALGENILLSDSGVVEVSPKVAETKKHKVIREEPLLPKATQWAASDQPVIQAQSVKVEMGSENVVSFPAIIPAEGYVTRGFEPEQNHIGLDIAGKIGNLIVAAADGNVVFTGWTYNDGYVVIISHAGGFMSFYKHNQSLLKTTGAFVRRGEPIATLGNSGVTSSGPHLHFEIWKDGIPVDPSAYIINFNL